MAHRLQTGNNAEENDWDLFPRTTCYYSKWVVKNTTQTPELSCRDSKQFFPKTMKFHSPDLNLEFMERRCLNALSVL